MEDQKKKEKRYYWLRLPRDFFHSQRSVMVKRKYGNDGLVIMQKLMLEAYTNMTGDDMIGIIPLYPNPDKKGKEGKLDQLAEFLGEDPETLKSVVRYLESLGEIEYNGVGDLVVIAGHELVGTETDNARRQREYRNRKKLNAEVAYLAKQESDNIAEAEQEN